eukprot:3315132-Alexandrium_andersonii.AAC.1
MLLVVWCRPRRLHHAEQCSLEHNCAMGRCWWFAVGDWAFARRHPTRACRTPAPAFSASSR